MTTETDFFVFGASIVYGAKDWKNGGWVQLLKSDIEKKSNFKKWVYNLGVPGHTSSDVLNRIEREIKSRIFDELQEIVVIVSVGINDTYYFHNNEKETATKPEKYKENIGKIIKIAKKYTKNVFFVGITPVFNNKLQPVPWRKEISYSLANCRKYNEIAKSVCKKESIPFLDLFSIFSKLNYGKLLDDGLHPTAEGHKKIFMLVKDFLNENRIS